MKEMNRREFLTLTGAAVVALSLAGCGGAPSAPTPSNDIRVQQALDALNQFRRDKGLTELVYEKELEELTDLLISPFVKEGKPVVDRTKFSSYVDVKEDEIKQALSNKGYPIYETYFTAGLGPEGGNVKKCAVGKHPKSEKHGNTAQFSEVERSGTQENCGGIGSGCRLRLRPLPVLRRRQSQRVARIDPNAVVVDKNIAENDRFDLFSR